MSCGVWHSMALSSKGEVFTCGQNKKGELGLGHDAASFEKVPSLSGVKTISAGKSVSAFVLSD